MHMMDFFFLKSMNTKSDENVSCRVQQSIAACLEYGVLIGNIFPLIKGVSRELTCLSLPQLVIVHMNVECILIVEAMYNGKDITFLGPHVCYVIHVLYNGNICNEI